MKYAIKKYTDDTEENAVTADACYSDGYSIWERHGEGLVMKFTVDDQGQLCVEADWPKQWDVEKVKAEAIAWATEWDVFSSTPEMDDDDCFIQVIR